MTSLAEAIDEAVVEEVAAEAIDDIILKALLAIAARALSRSRVNDCNFSRSERFSACSEAS